MRQGLALHVYQTPDITRNMRNLICCQSMQESTKFTNSSGCETRIFEDIKAHAAIKTILLSLAYVAGDLYVVRDLEEARVSS